jgi:hypothetical protein
MEDSKRAFGALTRKGLVTGAILVLIGMAMAPMSAQAVSAMLVHIGDAKSSSVARVDNGALRVGLTPTLPFSGVVHITTANVDGSFFKGMFTKSNVFKVTNVTFSNDGTAPINVRLRTQDVTSGTTCATPSVRVNVAEPLYLDVNPGQTIVVPFPTPMVLQAQCLGVVAFPAPASGADMYVTAVGYR